MNVIRSDRTYRPPAVGFFVSAIDLVKAMLTYAMTTERRTVGGRLRRADVDYGMMNEYDNAR